MAFMITVIQVFWDLFGTMLINQDLLDLRKDSIKKDEMHIEKDETHIEKHEMPRLLPRKLSSDSYDSEIQTSVAAVYTPHNCQ